MADFDVWSQQPLQKHAHSTAPAIAPHDQPQHAASFSHGTGATMHTSIQPAPLTLEAYMQLHGALTRGSQTVQRVLPGDASNIRVQELKQVTCCCAPQFELAP